MRGYAYENEIVNEIEKIIEQIQNCNEFGGDLSSLYKQLEDRLNEYTRFRNDKDVLKDSQKVNRVGQSSI